MPLSEGANPISVTVKNSGGAESGAAISAINLDTSAPGAPIILSPATSPVITALSSLTISGTCETGATVNPDAPNAIKLETFIFDALPLANRPMLLRTIRHERFSPVKSLEGVDSVVSARRDMLRRAAAWLEACGVGTPKNATGDYDCMIEISPLYALDAAMLKEREDGHRRVAPGASVLLE